MGTDGENTVHKQSKLLKLIQYYKSKMSTKWQLFSKQKISSKRYQRNPFKKINNFNIQRDWFSIHLQLKLDKLL